MVQLVEGGVHLQVVVQVHEAEVVVQEELLVEGDLGLEGEERGVQRDTPPAGSPPRWSCR